MMAFRALSLVILILAVYPIAVSLQVLVDTLWGNAEFIRIFLYESKRRLLLQVLNDSLSAGMLSAVWFALIATLYFVAQSLVSRAGHFARARLIPWLVVLLSMLVVVVIHFSLIVSLQYIVSCMLFALWIGLMQWRQQ